MSNPLFRYDSNRFFDPNFDPTSAISDGNPIEFHRTLPGYAPTPLAAMPALARELGLKSVWVKDESKRFGLNAFKALGASYAIYRFMQKHPQSRDWTFATATDGNHGRAVAWTAKRLGQKAVVFVPSNTVKARIDAIRGEGARVVVVEGTYDETVRRAAAESAKNGWQVISDTAYPGYMEIPAWIMQGYTTLFNESRDQLAMIGETMPEIVFTQAGVGGLACAAALFERKSTLISIEPTDADCLRESIASADGSIREAKGKQNSIMAGLNCGTPSLLAWPVIRATFRGFLAVDDSYAEAAMRRFASGTGGDPQIISGESGAAGLAGLLALCGETGLSSACAELGLGPDARVLLVNTEGDTDPVNYTRVVNR